ncbi:hypothetical protein BJX63DRAFT_421877 [Aspergillus granulosus]|uniref:Uncharacterized protein n=1 Tax=Aspergillus granulosus TaxID=176169 RepID=A0ABR4HA21_9EURO
MSPLFIHQPRLPAATKPMPTASLSSNNMNLNQLVEDSPTLFPSNPWHKSAVSYATPKEITPELMEECALRAFFHDYCIVPIKTPLSHVFLGGLELMAHRLGLQFQVKGEELYHELLIALAHTIKDPTVADTTETVVMAILLGLYEMIMARDTDSGNHRAHSYGLAALLQIENLPLSLIEAMRLGRLLLPKYSKGMFSTVCSYGRGKDLDGLLQRLRPVSRVSEVLLSTPSRLYKFDKLHSLLTEAEALNNDLAEWQGAQTIKFKPTTIGHIKPKFESSQFTRGVGFWPGHIDVYFDLYFAAVLNISRMVRCFLIDLLYDVIVSFPYLLAEDVQAFLPDGEKREISNPGRTAGGLLLMYPLYVLSRLPTVSPEMQDYFKRCLAGIGKQMGIGQAFVICKGMMALCFLSPG